LGSAGQRNRAPSGLVSLQGLPAPARPACRV